MTLDGSPARGHITFTASTVLTDFSQNEKIYPVPLAVTLDSNGFFSVNLPATNDPYLFPQGFAYVVVEEIIGSSGQQYVINIPYDAVGPLDIVDLGLIPRPSPPPTAASDDPVAFSLIFGD